MISKLRKVRRNPIPKHFKGIEEAGEFWDNHDLTDYWDLSKEVQIETNIQRRVFLTTLEPSLVQKLTEVAHKQGISTETLINVWLKEKVEETV